MADQPTHRAELQRLTAQSRSAPASTPPRNARARRRGMTLLELMVVLVVLSIAISMFSSTMVATARQGQVKRERSIAAEGVRRVFEIMRSETFTQIFARYNVDAADDPGGAGTGPGTNFAIPGLDPRPGDPDGMVGSIQFPALPKAGGVALREDIADPVLSMPRDLNADGLTDSADHSGDYRILPIRVIVEWRGPAGDQSLEMSTMFVNL